MINITCKHCKKTFQVHPYRKNTAIFCSHSCKASFRIGNLHPRKRAAEKRICTNCQKEYIVNKNFNRNIKFCSISCSGKYILSGARNYKWAGGVKPVACANCEKTFIPKRLGSVNKYCSKECRHIGAKIKTICPGCGKERLINKSKIEEGRKFCSQSCYRHNKIRPTFIEKTIQDRLTEIGIVFIPEYQVGRFFIDIFIPSVNIAIECDGAYWHKDRESNDTKKTDTLTSKGYKVLRYGESKIRKNPQECIDEIVREINIIQK